jgi:hypothetical protein
VGHRRNKGGNKKFLEFNKNENKNYLKLWDTAKAVLRGNFIAMSTYVKDTERSQMNNLILQLKLLENQEQANPKTRRRKEILKLKTEINKIETKKKKKIQSINKTKSWFFEKKIIRIDKPQANLTKMRREKTQIRNKKRGDNSKHQGNHQGLPR